MPFTDNAGSENVRGTSDCFHNCVKKLLSSRSRAHGRHPALGSLRLPLPDGEWKMFEWDFTSGLNQFWGRKYVVVHRQAVVGAYLIGWEGGFSKQEAFRSAYSQAGIYYSGVEKSPFLRARTLWDGLCARGARASWEHALLVWPRKTCVASMLCHKMALGILRHESLSYVHLLI